MMLDRWLVLATYNLQTRTFLRGAATGATLLTFSIESALQYNLKNCADIKAESFSCSRKKVLKRNRVNLNKQLLCESHLVVETFR